MPKATLDSAATGIVERLRKLLPVLLEQHEKTELLLREIDTILGGGAGIGVLLKQFQAAFSGAWEARYHTPYHFTFKIDVPAMKRMIAKFGVEECCARSRRYMEDPDAFLSRQSHPFRLLEPRFNQYADKSAETELDLTSPVDCRHTPACKTDSEHTRRRSAELRGA